MTEIEQKAFDNLFDHLQSKGVFKGEMRPGLQLAIRFGKWFNDTYDYFMNNEEGGHCYIDIVTGEIHTVEQAFERFAIDNPNLLKNT